MAQPIVTEAEFDLVQRFLLENQRFAPKNTRLRQYVLKGLIRCAGCGRIYTDVTRGNRSYYYCRGRVKADWGAERCTASKLNAPQVEKSVYEMVVRFLRSPEGFLAEMRRRQGFQEESAASLKPAGGGSVNSKIG